MDWFAPIDAYCERLGPGLAAEPLNALSNAAFFIAALWAARTAARKGVEPVIWLLIALVFVIGLGSLAFHTFADQWSELADVLPITLFIYGYLAFALRRFLGLDWWKVALALGVLFLVTLASAHVLPPGFMNGSGAYLPALIASVIVSLDLLRKGHPAQLNVSLASTILFVSLIFRTADQIVCPVLPIGTHFIWHILNGLVLALYLEAAIRYGAYRKP
ncbi:MAG: ceramidase domain-containing protein [Parvibaculaceae bacterium]